MAELRIEATHLGDLQDCWAWYEIDLGIGGWWRWEVGTPWGVRRRFANNLLKET